MKKFKIFSLGLVICFLISLAATLSGTLFAFAADSNIISKDIGNTTYDLLNNGLRDGGLSGLRDGGLSGLV